MPDYPQPLGRSMKSMGMIAPAQTDSPKGENDMVHPTVVLEWDKEYDLPDSGEITFKFRKAQETTHAKPKNGQPKQRVELDLLSIEDVEAGEECDECEDEHAEETGDVLDKAAKEKMAESEDAGEGE